MTYRGALVSPASVASLAPVVLGLALGLLATDAAAEGEKIDGYPSWAERVHLELTNRARVDPQVEMDQCGDNCTEAACYEVKPPLYLSRKNSRAARFHAAHMEKLGYFGHTSKCTLAPDIGDTWENGCDGAASCSCVGGEPVCNPSCTNPQGRVGLFGGGYFGEIIAGGSSPNQAFYLWLYESAGGNDACMFTQDNGHRWLLLTSNGGVGFGVDGYHVGDFGSADADEKGKIASGAHWPRAGNTVEAWANWYDQAAPSQALINVDGSCEAMSLGRGAAANGAYKAEVTGVGQGCHRYYFVFEDSEGNKVTYPSTGSLGIGAEGACEDWTEERPPLGPGCDCAPSCGGKECGDDGCGGSCGDCGPGESCDGSMCVCAPACDGKACGDDGCGGVCGTCAVDQVCSDGACVDGGDTGGMCAPDCAGKACGDDGCGGSCGSCDGGLVCSDGACVSGDGTTGGSGTGGSGTDGGATGSSASASGGSASATGSASDSGQALPDGYGDGAEDGGCACHASRNNDLGGAALLLTTLFGIRRRGASTRRG
ncbi:MAG: hypothetical protein KC486_20080 [Myxococcales bacterium]|nr:hypothetical protein [Myxococcales bacterium]